jgi:NAD(P)-dependent dehydrogenase (short-subunit alcohol dehydrogenase family)
MLVSKDFNKNILITGGSGLLGVEYLKFFLRTKSKIFIIDKYISPEVLNLKKKNKNLYFFKCDITKEKNLINCLVPIKKLGGVDVLINNAAIDATPKSKKIFLKPFEKFDVNIWDKVMDVNLKGVFLCCKIFGAAMTKKGGGSIVNVSSIYGILSPDQRIYEGIYSNKKFIKPITYSVSKAGVINMSRYLATYWAKNKIRVNNLILGGVYNNQPKKFVSKYCKKVPMGRMANKDEYNYALFFLASDMSSYMTGSDLVIDGGWSAW